MNYLATICARKNSQGIKNKNLQLINKKHLIGITIEQAKKNPKCLIKLLSVLIVKKLIL